MENHSCPYLNKLLPSIQNKMHPISHHIFASLLSSHGDVQFDEIQEIKVGENVRRKHLGAVQTHWYSDHTINHLYENNFGYFKTFPQTVEHKKLKIKSWNSNCCSFGKKENYLIVYVTVVRKLNLLVYFIFLYWNVVNLM